MGAAAVIGERHYVDAGAGVELGKYASLAGRGTQVWTHHRRRRHPEREIERAPVRIGERAYIGPRAVLLPGVELAEGVTVAPGAIVSAGAAAECRAGGLLAGNPAQVQADA
jgi:acetyltransferase-like isoleucine patch superfamily enzyme